MKTSETKKVKEIVEKLPSEKLNFPHLSTLIDFSKIDTLTSAFIEEKIKNANKSVREAKESSSIYLLENKYLVENKLSKLVKGTKEYSYFKGIRIKCRKYLEAFLNSSMPTKENAKVLLEYLKIHYTKPDLKNIHSFIGESSDKNRIENWKNWLDIVNNIK